MIRYSAGSAGSGHDSQRLCWPDRWWAWEDLNLRPHPERKIARVSTGSAALRAELGRVCPILIPRGGPRPWGSYQACSSYALFAARARDDQLSRGVHVTVVVRAIPGLAVRCGMRVARPARTNVVRSSWRRHQLACRARPVLSDHLPRWQGRRPAAAVAVRGRTRSHAALLAEVVAVAAELVLAVGAATAASAEPRVDARDPAWGGRPGRDRRAIGERWRSGWAHVRSLPDRLTSTASVCRQLVVRCWKRSSRSSVPALPVSVASKLRVATAKVEHTRPSTSGQVFEYRPVGAPTPRL